MCKCSLQYVFYPSSFNAVNYCLFSNHPTYLPLQVLGFINSVDIYVPDTFIVPGCVVGNTMIKYPFFRGFTLQWEKQTRSSFIISTIFVIFHMLLPLFEVNSSSSICLEIDYSSFKNQLISMTYQEEFSLLSSFLCVFSQLWYVICLSVVPPHLHVMTFSV